VGWGIGRAIKYKTRACGVVGEWGEVVGVIWGGGGIGTGSIRGRKGGSVIYHYPTLSTAKGA